MIENRIEVWKEQMKKSLEIRKVRPKANSFRNATKFPKLKVKIGDINENVKVESTNFDMKLEDINKNVKVESETDLPNSELKMPITSDLSKLEDNEEPEHWCAAAVKDEPI